MFEKIIDFIDNCNDEKIANNMVNITYTRGLLSEQEYMDLLDYCEYNFCDDWQEFFSSSY